MRIGIKLETYRLGIDRSCMRHPKFLFCEIFTLFWDFLIIHKFIHNYINIQYTFIYYDNRIKK